ncbi:DNA-directed RNA polymerase III subunit RPC5 [Larimichthys crocea]|uniref:Uncharacterized protein n=1 Tax=Larimichthys crocea TaxID=215358 RepID=A0ACD3RT86_LARCR|nr:DNA-directed RNA polymerase III subunit RPC5 [Larimichthys crocea]
MASGDDDDPIIEEIDVYLAKSLADKLYLFQYPVRPSTMTYDDVNHLAAKIKPKQQRVELEMAINTLSPNYCRSKGEQIALNVDGTAYDETNTYSAKMMDKQSFSSIQATTNTSRYAAAVFRKGELHVTPLTGILQMRPSFSYLDKADNKTREREAANEGEVRSSRVRAGSAEEDPVVRVPPEEAGRGALGSPALPRRQVKVMPFANLMGLLASGTDSTSALRCIQQVALLVQGNWVVKSDVLYPKNTCSPHSGVPAEVLCRGRDFVMWRFTLERSVMRKEITSIIKLPPEDVKEFLEHVAAPRVNRGWEFLLPTDAEFIKKHPDVAHRQHMLWLGIQSKLEKVFNFSKEDFMPKNSPQPEPVHISGEQRLKMAQERAKEKQPSLQKDLDAKRAGSSVHVKQEPVSDREDEPMDTSSPPSSSSVPNGSINGYPCATSPGFDHTNGNGGSPANTSSLELQDFVIKTFRKHFVLTLNEFKRLFNLHLASMPVGRSVFHSISDHMLQGRHTAQPVQTDNGTSLFEILFYPVPVLKTAFRVLNAEVTLLAAQMQLSVSSNRITTLTVVLLFPAQSTAASDEQKVFGLWETGEEFDKHRRLLYDLFTKNYRVRRNMIQAKLAQEFGDASKADVDRLLNECCSSYAGMWYLKGTIQS